MTVVSTESSGSGSGCVPGDTAAFRLDTCRSLPRLLEVATALKLVAQDVAAADIESDKPEDKKKMHQLRQRFLCLFSEMKQLNREVNLHSEHMRKATLTKKVSLDSLAQKHSSLLYEKAYVSKEIGLSKDFQSKIPEIELVSVEQLKKEAAEELRTEEILNDPRSLQRSLLTFEIQERKRYVEQIERMETRKQELQGLIKKEKALCGSIDKQLQQVFSAAKPLHTTMDLPALSIVQDHRIQNLCGPLYTLFSSLSTYQNVYQDKQMTLEIVGEPLDSQDLSMKDIGEEEGGSQISLDPLSVVLTLKQGTQKLLTMAFHTVVGATAVTVKTVPSDVVLCDLYYEDSGRSLPCDDRSLDVEKFGHAFLWAQSICGLHFPSRGQGAFQCPSVKHVIDAIRTRLSNEVALRKQLVNLHDRKLVIPVSTSSLFPLPPKSRFREFEEIDHQRFCGCTPELIPARGRFFRAQFSHLDGTIVMELFVQVPSGYPSTSPVYRVNLRPGTKYSSTQFPDVIRDKIIDKQAERLASSEFERWFGTNIASSIESELNADCNRHLTDSDMLLSVQFRLAQMCLDLVIAASSSSGSANDHFKGRLFVRPFRGRDRRVPFVFDSVSRCFVHRLTADQSSST